jgi:type IX secretion system PorP/SprF family membrane protein
MKIIKYIIACCFTIGVFSAKAQTFTYSQYMDNLTPVNPAYSLLDKDGSVTGVVRKQYVGVNGSPTTYLLNGSLPISSIGASAGLIVQNDELAIEKLTQINAFFAKSIHLNENSYLAVSLNAGFKSYKANYSQTANIDPNDPSFATDISESKPNMGFGVMYYSDKFYLGLSLPQLTLSSLGTASLQDNSNFKSHYYFTGAYLFDLAEDFKLKPAALVGYAKGQPTTADISGTVYVKNIFGVGLNYHSTGEMAGIFSVNFDQLHVGYSYQFGTGSTVSGFRNATHEVMLTYSFGKATKIL